MPNREQMWGPMSLEDYADKIGQDLSRRPVPLTGLDVLPPARTWWVPEVAPWGKGRAAPSFRMTP